MSEKLYYNDDDMCKWAGECPGCELSMCWKHRSVNGVQSFYSLRDTAIFLNNYRTGE